MLSDRALNEIKIGAETVAALEAVLFACGSPVSADKLVELFEISYEQLGAAVSELVSRYESERSGISLISIDGDYQLCTKAYLADFIKRALEMKRVPPLSKASLEVLAIIAYNQPVTRTYIEMIRGVDSSHIVSGLCDKGLIRESGTLDAPGRPVLFVTTDSFLRCFGLESLEELPISSLEQNTQITIDTQEAASQSEAAE